MLRSCPSQSSLERDCKQTYSYVETDYHIQSQMRSSFEWRQSHKINKQISKRYVHTQQRSHLQKGISKKPDMHPETSSTGINLAVISYTLCLKTGTPARYTLLQITSTNHTNKSTTKTKSGIGISINKKRCSLSAKRRIRRCISESQTCTPTAKCEYLSCRNQKRECHKGRHARTYPAQDERRQEGCVGKIWN
jgi:hypothetical protein